MNIDAEGVHYKKLNDKIRETARNGEEEIVLKNVNGQRYLGTGLKNDDVRICVDGVPGNDLAAFMDGPEITVRSNSQDAVGNTMNSGKVTIHGDAGDVVGHSMRGGKIYIRGNVGYRVGIHMKAYKDLYPVIIVGGKARDFLGEYMAGGLLILLGLDGNGRSEIVGNHIGTGMHGGEIFIRGDLEEHQLGEEVGIRRVRDEDRKKIEKYLTEYARDFDLELGEILEKEFIKLVPETHRPYGTIYAY